MRIPALFRLAVAATAIAWLSPAFSQPKAELPSKQIIDFNEVELTVDVKKPEHGFELVKSKTTFGNLIKLRGEFFDELSTSVDNL